MTIKETIFMVESMAHLQGKERLLLPVVDGARAEHEALTTIVEKFIVMVMDGKVNCGPRDAEELAAMLSAAGDAIELGKAKEKG